MQGIIASGVRRTAVILSLGLFVVADMSNLSAQAEVTVQDSEQKFLSDRLYKQMLMDLRRPEAEPKIKAIIFFMGRKNPRYVRVLGRELNLNLYKGSPFLRSTAYDPYVKSLLAQALGKIGHEDAHRYLLQALESTRQILEAELEETQRLRKAEEDNTAAYNKQLEQDKKDGKVSAEPKAIASEIPDRNQPGPALLRRFPPDTIIIPHSPDVYWSVSDEFKDLPAVDSNDSYYRTRAIGYNYVNLAVEVLRAIGDVAYASGISRGHRSVEFDKEIVTKVNPYLEHKLPSLRAAAAYSLGLIVQAGHTTEPMAVLEKRLEAEKDGVVQATICMALLRNEKWRTGPYKLLLKLLRDDDDYVRFSAAIALRDLAMGESLDALRRAYRIEERPRIRKILLDAIYHARIDNITPVSE